jgi:GAF domain-containing protein
MTDQQPHGPTITSSLLEQSLQHAMALIGAGGGAILLWDDDEQVLTTQAWINQPLASRSSRISLGEGLSGQVAAQRKGMVVNDYRSWSGARRAVLEHTPIGAAIGEPLLVDGRLIGVINLHDGGTGRTFTDRDVELLRLFADQAAMTIENACLYAAAQRELEERQRAEEALAIRTRQLEAVRGITEELTRELSLERLLDLILQRARELIGAAGGAIYFWDEAEKLLVPQAWSPPVEWMAEVRVPLGEGLVGRVAAERIGRVVNDYRCWTGARLINIDRTAINAGIAEPLMYRDRLIGIINLDDRGTGQGFSEQDLSLLRLFAAQAAIAIENARLFEEVHREVQERRRAEQGLRAQSEQLEIIRAVSQEIARELDLQAVLALIMHHAMALVGTRSATVFLWDRRTECLVPRAWSGLGEWFGQMRPRLGEGVVGEAARRRTGVIVNDYRTSAYTMPVILERTGIQTVVAEPLLYRDELVGAIVLRDRVDERPFDSEDLQLLNLFGVQAAIAIENARLFDELRDSYARLQEAQVSLLRSEKLRALGQMSAGIAHDLNNMLAAILGQVELLKLRVTDPDIREALSLVETATTDGAHVVRRLQDFARQRARGPLTSLDLGAVVREALEMTRPRWEDEPHRRGVKMQVRLDVPEGLRVRGIASEIREALTNIILNALDAMGDGGTLALSARLIEKGDTGAAVRPLERTDQPESAKVAQWVELAVSDSGVGMPEDVQRRVFDPFFTTKGVKGTGLGLSVVYGIMERHAGRVRIESAPGRGTTILLQFQPASEEEEKRIAADPPQGAARRILVIDDDPAVRTTLVSLLRASGHHVIEADGGAQGLTLLETHPELVITDLGMPDMTGWQVARAIRGTRPSLPIILLTGWRDETSEEEGDPALVNRILSKPIRLDELLQAIAGVMATPSS